MWILIDRLQIWTFVDEKVDVIKKIYLYIYGMGCTQRVILQKFCYNRLLQTRHYAKTF